MSDGQNVPAGYYVSNSTDEACFLVDAKGNYYFKKATGKTWSKTDKWNFDHICDVETVNEQQGVSADVNTHDGRGLEVSVSAHIGVSVSDVMKWHYVNPDGNAVTLWGGPSAGVGAGVSADVGLWYDKNGDIHMKFAASGVIPHIDFGASIVINPKTVEDLDKPTAGDKAFANGFTEGATLGLAHKSPEVVTKTVATIHKFADDIGKLL